MSIVKAENNDSGPATLDIQIEQCSAQSHGVYLQLAPCHTPRRCHDRNAFGPRRTLPRQQARIGELRKIGHAYGKAEFEAGASKTRCRSSFPR